MSNGSVILDMKKISKSFPGVKALDNVDFNVRLGEVHCLIGANGAGKSTLMKILAGAYQADSGEIFINGVKRHVSSPLVGQELGISVIYQELSLIDELSVAENIFLGNYPRKNGFIDWRRMRQQAQEIIDGLGIRIDVSQKVGAISIGHKQITELAKAMASNAKIIVMDEPSATLSQEEFDTLVRVIKDLKDKGITIIYISHRLEELFIVGDRVTVLKDGMLVDTTNINELTRDNLVEKMIGHSLSDSAAAEVIAPKDKVLLAVEQLTTGTLKNVNLEVKHGEIVGLYGLVGSGRTEILRAIFGADPINQGRIKIDSREVKVNSPLEAMKLGIGLIPEQRKTQGLVTELPVWENAVLPSLKEVGNLGVLSYGKIFDVVREQVNSLNIKTPSVTSKVKNLSGGNQQKVVIAKWLIKKSNILLFDEPTQGIDVGAKEEVYSIISALGNKEGVCTVVASSELQELLDLCHRIMVLYEGEIVAVFTRQDFNKENILHAAITGGSEDFAVSS